MLAGAAQTMRLSATKWQTALRSPRNSHMQATLQHATVPFRRAQGASLRYNSYTCMLIADGHR